MIKTLDSWVAGEMKISEPLTSEKIQKVQLEKLRSLVEDAKNNSEFYKGHFKGKTFQTLNEFSKLPFTKEEDLRKKGNQWICTSQSEISRVVTLDTTGTTGVPKRVFFTKEDQGLTLDYFENGLEIPFDSGDVVLILMPFNRPGSIGDLVGKAFRKLMITPIFYGFPDSFSKIVEIMKKNKVTGVLSLPLPLLGIGEYLKLQKKHYPLKSVLLSGDNLPNVVRERISTLFSCEIFNHYGSTESGLGGALECHYHRGMHIRENDLYFEIIDPISKEALPDGEWGELVVTTLTRQGMPFIRYRTGDYTRILKGSCSCGSHLKSLDTLKGRVKELMNYGLFLSDLDEWIFKNTKVIDFKISLKEKKLILQSFEKIDAKGWIDLEILKGITLKNQIINDFQPLYDGKRCIS